MRRIRRTRFAGARCVVIPGMGHDVPAALVPVLVALIAEHATAAVAKRKHAIVFLRSLVGNDKANFAFFNRWCMGESLGYAATITLDHGIELDRSTLADWVGHAAWHPRPLQERLLVRLKE